jgi:hypothetical protein
MTKGLFRLNILNHQAYTCSSYKVMGIAQTCTSLHRHHMTVLPFEKLILSILLVFRNFTSRVLTHEPKHNSPRKKHL